jgi:hypothetical protein
MVEGHLKDMISKLTSTIFDVSGVVVKELCRCNFEIGDEVYSRQEQQTRYRSNL